MNLVNKIEERGIVRVSRETGVARRTLWMYQKGTQSMTLAMAEKLQAAYGGSVWQWWEMDAKKAAIKAEKEVSTATFHRMYPATVNETGLEGNFRGRVLPGKRVTVLGYSGDINFPIHVQGDFNIDAYVKPEIIQEVDYEIYPEMREDFSTTLKDHYATYNGETYLVESVRFSTFESVGYTYELLDTEGEYTFEVDPYETMNTDMEVRYAGGLSHIPKWDKCQFLYGDLARYKGEPVIIKDVVFDICEDGYEGSVVNYILEDGRNADPEDLFPHCPDKVFFTIGDIVVQEAECENYSVYSVDPYKEDNVQIENVEGVLCWIDQAFLTKIN